MVKSISILGCTGSIGRQTIAVAEHIVSENRHKLIVIGERCQHYKYEKALGTFSAPFILFTASVTASENIKVLRTGGKILCNL